MHKHVTALTEAGVLEPMQGQRRGLRLRTDGDVGVPLLGRIAAGRPIEAIAGEERCEVPAWLLPSGACYVLEVRGDSMRDDGIRDGDRIVVSAGSAARDGDVVVALVDGAEATLKRLYRRRGKVVLQPANPDYEAIELAPERVVIQGVAKALMRRLD